ncbi:hypothetical protein H9Q08_17070 [Chryseobacterium sp. PS-8]|uniref:Uncharacterized protein n=1 Tax=Chryseobacterium indicum TaxID=2766954 RepID=A0ABS9C8W1_9FLAO|nr:hypothetical protein [Chryseobacterium sp. PS-8]MCF2220999.1 hypothetical protein [Chryseobacterium sp. PS-8]
MKIRNTLNSFISWLKNDYTKPSTNLENRSERKPEDEDSSENSYGNFFLAKWLLSLASLTFGGFIYLTFYMEHFGIAYEVLYFNLNDCTSVLYEKSVLLIYIVLISIGGIIPLFFFILKSKSIKNLGILSLSLAIILFVGIYLHISIHDLSSFIILIIFFIFSVYLFFFKNRDKGALLFMTFFVLFCAIYAKADAKNTEQRQPKFDIVIKDGDQSIKILSETDNTKYLIKKTNEYIFIMDRHANKINIYPSSSIQSISFTYKEKK